LVLLTLSTVLYLNFIKKVFFDLSMDLIKVNYLNIVIKYKGMVYIGL